MSDEWLRRMKNETMRIINQVAISKGTDISPQKFLPVLWKVCDQCEEANSSFEIDCQLINCNAGNKLSTLWKNPVKCLIQILKEIDFLRVYD